MENAGWYRADGDPPGTMRWWDGTRWIGEAIFEPQAQGPPPHVASDQSAPSPAVRIGARLLDLLIVFIFLVVLILIGPGTPESLGGGSISLDISFGSQRLDSRAEFLIWGLFSFAWSTGWIATTGATPGKRLLDMKIVDCLLYTSPSPRDATLSRMPSSA